MYFKQRINVLYRIKLVKHLPFKSNLDWDAYIEVRFIWKRIHYFMIPDPDQTKIYFRICTRAFKQQSCFYNLLCPHVVNPFFLYIFFPTLTVVLQTVCSRSFIWKVTAQNGSRLLGHIVCNTTVNVGKKIYKEKKGQRRADTVDNRNSSAV